MAELDWLDSCALCIRPPGADQDLDLPRLITDDASHPGRKASDTNLRANGARLIHEHHVWLWLHHRVLSKGITLPFPIVYHIFFCKLISISDPLYPPTPKGKPA